MRKQSSPEFSKIRKSLSCGVVILMMLSPLLSVAHHGAATAGRAQEDSRLMTIGYSENFDGVTAPALPTGWTSSGSQALPPFVTSPAVPHTAPNSLFIPDPSTVGLSEVVSPPVQIGSAESRLTFRNFYDTEPGFDGGVLEIKIGGSAFQDILQAGGSFVSGGYNSTISSGFSNPLAGRAAWSNSSNGYIATEVIFPTSALGQMIQLKWRMGSDDSVADVGWRIDTVEISNTISAENTASIMIPDSGVASLYPSTVTVANLVGAITNVIVVLNNFSHTAPDDVDLLLVSPGGRKVVLMSDVGGTAQVSNLSLTIQDSAANFMPDESPLFIGSFKPTNIGADDVFPAPAPQGPATGNTLAAFNGANPNGTWSLYLVDDNGNNAGSISGGWSMLIVTDATACSLNVSSNLQVFPITGGTGSFDVLSPFGCDWTATSLSSFITITSGSSGSGGTEPVSFTVAPNMFAGRTGVIRVSNAGFTRDFIVQQPSGCPFALSQETQNFGSGGGVGSVQVTAAGVCGWSALTKDNWITINNGSGSGNGTVTFTVAPNTTQAERTGTVMIGARTLTIMQGRAASGARAFDFDGDGKSDVSVFRPQNGTWYISNSSNGNVRAQQFGLNTDRRAPADFDDDNKADLTVFRGGDWYVLRSSDNIMTVTHWGATGDVPVPADYDGDNKIDYAVFRIQTGVWYVRRSTDGNTVARQFGMSGDRPITGDFDNDGKCDMTVYRAGETTLADSFWYVLRSSDGGVITQRFGRGEDIPVAGDYDGDGVANFAVFRPSTGTWYTSLNPATNYGAIQWGANGDTPLAGDYDGDGKSDAAVFREGAWNIRQSSNGALLSQQWGTAGDYAVPSAFNSF